MVILQYRMGQVINEIDFSNCFYNVCVRFGSHFPLFASRFLEKRRFASYLAWLPLVAGHRTQNARLSSKGCPLPSGLGFAAMTHQSVNVKLDSRSADELPPTKILKSPASAMNFISIP